MNERFSTIRRALLASLALAATAIWWGTILPPAVADWAPDVTRQVTGLIDGDRDVVVHGTGSYSDRDYEPLCGDQVTEVEDVPAMAAVIGG